MKRIVILITVLILFCVAGTWLYRKQPDFLPVVLKVELTSGIMVPRLMDVDSSGLIYVVEQVRGVLTLQVYDQRGHALWRMRLCGTAHHPIDAIVLSLPGRRPVTAQPTQDQRCNINILWVTVSGDRTLGTKLLGERNLGLFERTQVVPARGYFYITGDTEVDNAHSYPTVMKLDPESRLLWKVINRADGGCGPCSVDSEGNLIVTGDIGAGVGPFIIKYLSESRRLWQHRTEIDDGTWAAWARADNWGNIFTIFALHVGSADDAGENTYGRDQDYVLTKYSSAGKVLSTTTVSHGAWLNIVDAAVGRGGHIVALGNEETVISRRPYIEHTAIARLIKCDPNGAVKWSRGIKLPDGCVAECVRLDDRGGIYVFGRKDDSNDESRHSVKAFIYKVLDEKQDLGGRTHEAFPRKPLSLAL